MSVDEPIPEDFGLTQELVDEFNKNRNKIFRILFFVCFMTGTILVRYRNYDSYNSGETSYLNQLAAGIFLGMVIYGVFMLIYLVAGMLFLSRGKVTGPILSFNRAMKEYRKAKK